MALNGRKEKLRKISLLPLALAQVLMILPLSLWEGSAPSPDTVVYSPLSYYNWTALIGRAGNWPAVAVSVLMPLWLALTVFGVWKPRKAWVATALGLAGCGVLALGAAMALVWRENTPIGYGTFALQLLAAGLQLWRAAW